MALVTFRGTGQLNLPVVINTTIEANDTTARNLGGQNRNDVKKAILEREFPDVKIDPKNVGTERDWCAAKKVNN